MGNFINAEHARIFELTSAIPGWQLPGDSELLFEVAHKSGDVILEIGTYAGRSAVAALKGTISAGRRPVYYGVDINPTAIDNTTKTLKKFGLEKNAILFQGTITSFLKRFYISPSMVFVDGDHKYEGVKSDLLSLSAVLRAGTPIVCHDYLNPETPGVKLAVDEWINAGWAASARTDGCSILLIASSKCADHAISYPRFLIGRAVLSLQVNRCILALRATLKLRTRAKRLARYITLRI